VNRIAIKPVELQNDMRKDIVPLLWKASINISIHSSEKCYCNPIITVSSGSRF